MYLVPFHRAETSLAGSLLRLLTTKADRLPAFAGMDWARALAWLRTRTGVELAAEQEQAVRLALTSTVAVLTGGPGCGKSFTVKSVIALAAAKKGEDRAGGAARQLGQLPPGTPPRQRQWRIAAGRDHHMRVRRHALQEGRAR